MRLDVAVHQSRPMRVPHTATCLDHQFQGFIDAESLFLLDERLQVGAWHVFHHDEQMFLVQTKIVDCDDIWVGEVGGCLGFLPEAFAKRHILRKILSQCFNCNITLEHQVFGFINNSHSAGAQRLFELVAVIKYAQRAHTT